ncbi:hypothetical protein F5144DRAFT_190922 [Chaetomium tenue]|uniref:Uncharacterized protein n=1 Tax=Chaetomium tenue TaxID=1854479 RepID=A0ACB7PEF6_9PEZI|nr:hypothetical protein F5144DRAFT_190922 [Chaetomium globosum]
MRGVLRTDKVYLFRISWTFRINSHRCSPSPIARARTNPRRLYVCLSVYRHTRPKPSRKADQSKFADLPLLQPLHRRGSDVNTRRKTSQVLHLTTHNLEPSREPPFWILALPGFPLIAYRFAAGLPRHFTILPRTSEFADHPDVNHADSSKSFHYLFMVEGEPSGIASIHQEGHKEGPGSEVTGTKSCQFSILSDQAVQFCPGSANQRPNSGHGLPWKEGADHLDIVVSEARKSAL